MKKLGIVLFIMLSSNLFGADPSIYTWGYGEIFYKVLQGVTIISKESYLITSAVAIGGFLLMIKNTANGGSSSDMSVAMGKYLFLVTIIIGMFSTQTKTYIVEDEVTGQTFPVNNVPIGIGETFSLFTDLERNLAKGFEIAFATPNSISYRNTGLGFTMAAPINLGNAVMVDAYVVRTFNEYMGNCVFSAIIANEMSGDILTMSKNLKTDLSVTGYLTPYYSSANPDGVDMQCQDVWANLTVDLGAKLDDMERVAADKMMLDQTTFQSGMSETTRLMFGVSQNSKDYLMQQTLINMSNDGIKAVALATGGDASALAYAKALSETNQQQTWTVTGMLAQQNLPLMKATMTILILGIFILLVLLSVIYGDLGHIKMGFTLLFAMVLWTPLALLVNGMFNIAIERILPSISNGGLTMVNINDVDDNLKNYLSFLGYLAASIPVFAYSIAKKSEHGFVSLFGGVGAASTSAASSATSQTSSGNISAGNSRLGSFNATDMYGTHDYLGNDSWRNTKISDNGTMRNSYSNKYGEGTTSTDSGGLADIVTNGQEIVKVSNSTMGVSAISGISDIYNASKQNTQQAGDAFSDSYARNIVNTLSSGGQLINTGTFTDSKGQQHQAGETLNAAVNESTQNTLNDMIASGRVHNFSTEDATKIGGGVSWATPKFLGAGVNGDASISLTGKTSTGEDVSIKLSGAESESFMESYTKNLSEQISQTDGLAFALAKQTQETQGFADSDTKTAAENYAKSYQSTEAISDAYSVAQKNDKNFSEDLLPKIYNKFIDEAVMEDGTKLSDIREKEGAVKASELAASMMRDETYKDQRMNAINSVLGVELDTNKANNAQAEIDKTGGKFDADAHTYKSINLKESVAPAIKTAQENTSSVPNNKEDIKREEENIRSTYDKQSKEHLETSDKKMNEFEDKKALHVKDEIENKTAELEKKRKTAQDETGILKAAELNPAAKTFQDTTDSIFGKSKNEMRADEAYTKAVENGVISKGMLSDSLIIDNINKLSTQELKDLQTWEKNHSGPGLDNASEKQLEQVIQHREKLELQEQVKKGGKEIKSITEALAELREKEQ